MEALEQIGAGQSYDLWCCWNAGTGGEMSDKLDWVPRSRFEEARSEIERLKALLAKEPCPYCTGKFTGLPNNACENCMNTGSKYPEYVGALEGK